MPYIPVVVLTPGALLRFCVVPGQWVNHGDVVAVLEDASGYPVEVEAIEAGTLCEYVLAPSPALLPSGTILTHITPLDTPLEPDFLPDSDLFRALLRHAQLAPGELRLSPVVHATHRVSPYHLLLLRQLADFTSQHMGHDVTPNFLVRVALHLLFNLSISDLRLLLREAESREKRGTFGHYYPRSWRTANK